MLFLDLYVFNIVVVVYVGRKLEYIGVLIDECELLNVCLLKLFIFCYFEDYYYFYVKMCLNFIIGYGVVKERLVFC